MKIKLAKLHSYWVPDIERCGFVLTTGEILEAENIHNNPAEEFEICPSEFESYTDRVAAVWHSHPITNANLSLADYDTFDNFRNLTHIIVGQHEVISYKFKNSVLLIDEVYRGNN